MGILNVTPDSFYDGGKHDSEANILSHAGRMLQEGAYVIDVGGYSSRPGAVDIPLNEELERVVPVIASITKEFPDSIISVDTFRSEVARAAVDVGASVINDISGGHLDDRMHPTVADLNVPYIAMHMKGDPGTMKGLNQYNNLMLDIRDYFTLIINSLTNLNFHKLLIDPGFGFAKDQAQNYELLDRLDELSDLGAPMVVGVSRKSMLYKPLGRTAADALNATTAANMLALERGASMLRVHDVAQAVETIKIHTLASASRKHG